MTQKKQFIQSAMQALERGRRFVTHEVWHIGAPGEEVPHGFIVKQLRVAILLVQNLVRDALTVRAAALTFATALGIIPFLAIVFFVIQTFNLDTGIYEYLSDVLEAKLGPASTVVALEKEEQPGQEGPEEAESEGAGAVAEEERDLKQEFVDLLFQGVAQLDEAEDGGPLENPVASIVKYAQKGADAQTIGLAGLVFVLVTVFGLMRNIESSFNTIWGLKLRRSWYRMFSDYLTLVLLLPFVVVLVLSVTAILESGRVRSELGHFAFVLRGVQYGVIWLAFTAMYLFVPNTRVRLRYALAGGVVAGTLWCLLSWGYVKFQVGLPRYSLFYSTFAQVPVLLMWVYLSWLILLFGAELTFAYQHEKTFAMERLAEGASYAYREALGLWVMCELGKRFDKGLAPWSVVQSAERWHVPTRLLGDTLETLEAAGLVTQCDSHEAMYQPARSLNRITVGDIIGCLREAGRDPSNLREEGVFRPLIVRLFDRHAGLAAETLEELIQEQAAAPDTRVGLSPDPEEAR